jgi:alanyl-tRNA synthetase
MFRELVNKHKYRILNKIPASYVPPAERINQATSEAERLRKELEETKARLAALEGGKSEDVKEDVSDEDNRESEVDYSKLDYKDLQKMAKDKGIDHNQKKAVLIAELSKADTESAE